MTASPALIANDMDAWARLYEKSDCPDALELRHRAAWAEADGVFR